LPDGQITFAFPDFATFEARRRQENRVHGKTHFTRRFKLLRIVSPRDPKIYIYENRNL
jgi:hypothetical protein